MSAPAIINKRYAKVKVDEIETHPDNPRQGDIGAIHGSLDAHGFYGTVIVQESTGYVLAGNHRLIAARQAGMKTVPVVYVDVDDETAKRIMIADNRTAELATNDTSKLVELLKELAETESGLDGVGYDGDDLDALLRDVGEGATEYTSKVESPVYEPSDEQPPLSALVDTSRYDALLQGIKAAKLPNDLRDVLEMAAARHLKFDYEAMANYYAHAPAKVQRLMEASALVIIDYEQAIDLGFVRLYEGVTDAFEKDHPDA